MGGFIGTLVEREGSGDNGDSGTGEWCSWCNGARGLSGADGAMWSGEGNNVDGERVL